MQTKLKRYSIKFFKKNPIVPNLSKYTPIFNFIIFYRSIADCKVENEK